MQDSMSRQGHGFNFQGFIRLGTEPGAEPKSSLLADVKGQIKDGPMSHPIAEEVNSR